MRLPDRLPAHPILCDPDGACRTYVELADDAIAITDLDGRFVSLNAAAERLYGHRAEDLIGKRLHALVPPEMHPQVDDVLARVRRGETVRVERAPVRADGTVVHVAIAARCIPDATGALSHVMLVPRDISDRRRQEEVARRQREDFDALIERTPQPLLIHVAGVIRYVNPAMVALLGYPDAAALVGKAAIEMVPPDERDAMQRRVAETWAHGSLPIARRRILHRDGRLLPIDAISIAVQFHGEAAIASVVNDVSEHERSVERLRDAHDILEEAQEAGHVGTWSLILQPEERLVLSREALRMTGLPSDRPLTSADFFALVQADTRYELRLDDGRADTFDKVLRLLLPDGRVRVVRSRGRTVRDAAGHVTRLVGTLADLTEQVRAEEDRDRFFEMSSDLFFVFSNVDLTIVRINPAVSSVLGWSAEEMVGHSFGEFIHPDDVAAAMHLPRASWASPSKERIRNRYRTRDGRYRWLEWTWTSVPALHVTYASGRDVTDARNLEQQLQQAQKMEAIGRLAGGVAHDFNNLLSVILGVGEMVARDVHAGDPLGQDLDEILTAARRASALTRQLLAFSRRQVIQPRTIDLGDVLRESERMLRRLIGEDVELVVRSGAQPSTVFVDPAQIDQVVMNLAVNARDAMPHGGRLTVELTHVTLDEAAAQAQAFPAAGPYVLLSVGDSGVGMDAATRSRIFEPFFTTKGPGKGTGLGLSTVYGVVQQAGGHILVDSELGRGATFRVYLPHRLDETAAAHVATTGRPQRATGERVLVVEDEPQVRSFVRRALERGGYRVVEAGNGAEALAVAAEAREPIDLVLTDVVMPRMSGPAFAERLRALRPGMRVVYMSGYTADMLDPHHVLEASIDLIEKPLRPESLLRKIREVLERPA